MLRAPRRDGPVVGTVAARAAHVGMRRRVAVPRVTSYDHRVATRQTAEYPGEGQRPQRHLPGARQRARPTVSCPMEEHRQRVRSATTAATLGELQSLVSDLQTANAPVQLPNLKPARLPVRRRLGHRAAIAGVLVVLGIGIGWGLYGNTPSPLSFTSDPGAKSDGIAPVRADTATAAAVTGRADRTVRADAAEVRRHHRLSDGHLPGLRVAGPARPERRPAQVLSTPTAAAGATQQSIEPDERRRSLVDLGEVRHRQAVVGILRGAPETLGIKHADVKSTVSEHRTRRGIRPRPTRWRSSDLRLQRVRQRVHRAWPRRQRSSRSTTARPGS